jgi:O-antigen ligase
MKRQLINGLIYLVFFLFSFGQLGRISFFNQQINFYLYELVLLFLLVLWVWQYGNKPIKTFWEKYPSLFYLLAILFFSFLITASSYSRWENLVAFLYWLRLILYTGYWIYGSYWINRTNRTNTTNTIIIEKSLTVFSLITIFSTLVQYFFYPDLRNLYYQGWDPHLYRTFGLFFDTAIAASIFAILFFVNQKVIIKFFFLAFLVFSFSRSAYLSFLISFLYLMVRDRQIKKLFFVLIFFVLLVIFSPKPFGEGVNLKRVFTINARIEEYRLGLNLFLKKPLLGYGYNRIRSIKKGEISSHAASSFSSSYLNVLVTSGFIGLLSFFYFISQLWKKNKTKRAIILFIFIFSFFDNIFFHPFILFLFFSLLFDRSP